MGSQHFPHKMQTHDAGVCVGHDGDDLVLRPRFVVGIKGDLKDTFFAWCQGMPWPSLGDRASTSGGHVGDQGLSRTVVAE